MDLRSKKEVFFLHNSLTCLPLGLVGKVTTIDLRNEASVTGLIERVDGFMNITMSNIVYVDGDNKQLFFEDFFVKARNIRYIHIPDEVSIIPTIQDQLRILQGRRGEGSEKRKGTYRQSKLQKRQQETLKLVEEEKKKKSGKK